MNDLIGLTITGIISGIFAGFVGAGAEILIVPLLTLFSIFDSIKLRIGTSLLMLLPPIGIFAIREFYKAGEVNVYYGIYLAILFTLFSYLSSLYSVKMDDNLLKNIFAIFTIASGVYLLRSDI
ncbi:MAG: permease [Rhodobacteraceae bacterium]|nr:MAG: permease [Paracoccaceae bacterium]|tara:strand:+ start:3833 stop:4201 length:369 start_codon:yes stop_codon:yes gene_type:complete